MIRPRFGDEFVRLTLHREPGAAAPGSRPRLAAEGALRALEDALDEPGYAQDAGRRLFPGGDDTSLGLRATRDWVLFRRRAVLRCGSTVKAPVRTDGYAVYGVVSDGEVARRRYLGEVRFTRDSATLAGGSDAVAGAWDDIAHGDRLVAAGVVEGPPGGDQLGLERVDELVRALTGATTPATDLQPKVLQPDVDLDAHDADGILVVVAAPAPAPAGTIEVAVVALDAQLVPRYAKATSAELFQDAFFMVFDDPHILGTVTFPENSAAPSKPEQLEIIDKEFEQQLGGAGVARVDIYTATGDAGAGDVATRTGRAAAIGKAIGGIDKTRVFDVEDSLFDKVRDHGLKQRTLVVVVPARTVGVAVFAVGPQTVDGYMRELAAGNVAAALKAAFAGEIGLGTITFEDGSPTPLSPAEMEAITEKYKSAVNAPAGRVDVITVQDDPEGGDEQTRRGRGGAVEKAVGGANEAGQLLAVAEDVYASTGVSPQRTTILVVPELPG